MGLDYVAEFFEVGERKTWLGLFEGNGKLKKRDLLQGSSEKPVAYVVE